VSKAKTVIPHLNIKTIKYLNSNNENTIYLTRVLLLAFIIVQLFALNGQNIETYPYVVDKKYDTFEIHKLRGKFVYGCQTLHKEFKEASGFSILAGYIFEEIKRMKK
jgi:hypothetical protein